MQHISATIITRNEEHNIERCLDALQGVVDEIVVVDSYSTDRTVEICNRYGCRITSREFRGFGSQRQYAAGLTKYSYVLSIDADEMLDEQLRQSLIELKRGNFGHRIYAINVKTYFCGMPLAHSGFEPEHHVRLFNKRYANWNLHDVSDSVSYPESVMPVMLPGAIHHYRCSTPEEFETKENRIASLRARAIANSTESVSVVSAWMRATSAYLRCMVCDKAWLDGRRGLSIARRKALTAYRSYNMARSLRREASLSQPAR